MLLPFRLFFFSSRRRHTRLTCDWSSDVCSSDLRMNGTPLLSVVVDVVPVCRPDLPPWGKHRPFTTCVSRLGRARRCRRSAGVTGRRSEERRVGKSVDVGGSRSMEIKMGCEVWDV